MQGKLIPDRHSQILDRLLDLFSVQGQGALPFSGARVLLARRDAQRTVLNGKSLLR